MQVPLEVDPLEYVSKEALDIRGIEVRIVLAGGDEEVLGQGGL